jgi:hypothetical protein
VSGYKPKVGDRVRVAVEGLWNTPSDTYTADGTHAILTYRASGSTVWIPSGMIKSIEPAPEPEPEWQPHDQVRDASGRLLTYLPELPDNAAWLTSDDDHLVWLKDAELDRPLTLLVRDGKAVKP